MTDNTSFDLMREINALKKDQKRLVRIIANDLYSRFLKNFVYEVKEEKAKKIDPNRRRNEFDNVDEYIYDLDVVILGDMGFNIEQIDSELGYWYDSQAQKFAASPNALNKENLLTTAIRIYFELNELTEYSEENMNSEIIKRLKNVT